MKSYIFKQILFLWFFSLNIFCQNFVPILGLTNSGTGGRAAGMGFAYTAIAEDMSAFTWNPAGFAQLETKTFQIEAKMSSRTWDQNETNRYQPQNFKDFWLNCIGLFLPYEKINLAIGIRRLYLWNDIRHYTYSASHTGDIFAPSVAIARKFWDFIFIGVDYQYIFGEMNLDRSEPMDIDIRGHTIGLGLKLKMPFGLYVGGKYAVSSNLDMKIKHYVDDDDGWFNFDFSGNYKITVPDYYNFGLAIVLTDNMIVAFDYHSEPWSQSKWEDIKWVKEDVNSYHFGFEYTGFSQPLRFGGSTVPTAFRNDSSEQIQFYSVNTGTAFDYKNITFDFSFEYIFGSIQWEHDYYDSEKKFKESINEYRLGVFITLPF